MKEPNGNPEESHRSDPASANPRISAEVDPERNHEEKTEARQDHAYEGEDEIEQSLRLFWNYVKRTFREANPGERLTAWLTMVLIVCSLAVALIYWLQLRQMRFATTAATTSADTAAKSLWHSEMNFRNDRRAWLVFKGLQILDTYPASDKSPVSWKYGIDISNVGQSLARNITVHVSQISGFIEPAPAPNLPTMIQRMQEGGQNGPPQPAPESLAPGQTSSVPVFGTGAGAPLRMGKGQWGSIVIGRIDYVDIWGVSHWTTFCFYPFDQEGHLMYCKGGNAEDNNPEPAP
jgi:hypothetical protein